MLLISDAEVSEIRSSLTRAFSAKITESGVASELQSVGKTAKTGI